MMTHVNTENLFTYNDMLATVPMFLLDMKVMSAFGKMGIVKSMTSFLLEVIVNAANTTSVSSLASIPVASL